ncbi:MAG: HypC/HybG/HupF family hydrogenase formation chaperone [Gemmatimonadaceae bacterium]|nr:HypC/HybG/HupF family hydrogenase formation chaperone [Geodermatophilaceae bacterium]MBA3671364.1 HypC/HybG/HupF family hydrogenase formation chaperone [Gemmatimonadaceae bacterium]
MITRATCDTNDGSCHVCGDVAVAGRIVAVDSVSRTALVTLGAEQVTVALDLVDAGLGDDVLVHLGFAIERLERA